MRLKGHVVATLTISSIVYIIYKSIPAFITSLIGGIFIDVDHLVDYYIHRGIDLRIKRFFNWCYRNEWETLIIFFHSIELIFILWITISMFNLGLFWIGLAIGVSQHLILDILVNREIINAVSYFFIFRCIKGFRKEYIMRSV